jgi:hypothetical protein
MAVQTVGRRERTPTPAPERATSPTRPGRAGLAVTPAVIRRQVMLEEIDLSPDGRSVVFVRRHIAGLEYRRHLWSVPLRGGLGDSLRSRGHEQRLELGRVRLASRRVRRLGKAAASVPLRN